MAYGQWPMVGCASTGPSAINHEPSAISHFSVSHPHSERSLCRREPRYRYSIRRRADVVETDLLEEMNRRRIAAVLAADSELQGRTGLASELNAHAHDRSDALGIDRR